MVDWRASVAVPFYRATFRDPRGLQLRRRFILEEGRRIVELLDEDFNDPDTASVTSASGPPDPLLAELGRSRTGTLHDIVATIAAEQDRIIRAPLDTPLIVQGGPGTGKTAIGLHRAGIPAVRAPGVVGSQGVLVLGPNRLFLAYISQMLPSLGEAAVVQTTLPGRRGLAGARAGRHAASDDGLESVPSTHRRARGTLWPSGHLRGSRPYGRGSAQEGNKMGSISKSILSKGRACLIGGVVLAGLAGGALVSSAQAAPRNLRLHGSFTTRPQTVGCTSPVGFCLIDVFRGTLNGPGEAITASVSATPDPSIGEGDTNLVIHDTRGDLTCRAQSVFAQYPNNHSEFAFICLVNGGTRRFAGATGYMLSYGSIPPGKNDFVTSYAGTITLAH